jgi:hypothetical protein
MNLLGKKLNVLLQIFDFIDSLDWLNYKLLTKMLGSIMHGALCLWCKR